MSTRYFHNRLLIRLADDDIDSFGTPETVALGLRQQLDHGPSEEAFVYFIEDGVASVVATADSKISVELGIVGREGMTGLGALYGDAEPVYQTFMQVEGSALRFEAGKVAAAFAARPSVRAQLLKYARAFSIQVATTAVANGRASLDARLCRWLLMISDRVGPSFNITHEFISVMLAVRRSGVTLAVQTLEGKGFIRAGRGTITVVDREGLIVAANGSYGFAEREYERLMGVAG